MLSIGDRYAVWVNSVNAFNTWLTDPSASHLDETGIGIGAWDNPSGEAFDNVACYPLTFRLPNELRWGAVPPVQRGGDVIGQDSFTHTDGWRLRAHMPEAGKDWYEQTNIWTIQDNRATASPARRRTPSPPSSSTASTPSCRSSCTPQRAAIPTSPASPPASSTPRTASWRAS